MWKLHRELDHGDIVVDWIYEALASLILALLRIKSQIVT